LKLYYTCDRKVTTNGLTMRGPAGMIPEFTQWR